VAEVLPRITGWAAAANPDIVLIHLGSNDALHGRDVGQTLKGMSQIIQALRQQNPRVMVFVAKLIPTGLPIFNIQVGRFNAGLPELADEFNTPEAPLILVDQFSGFDPVADTYDGVHPNGSGASKMATRWYQALRANMAE
jgi:lysophospholipase L1-like esterase